MKEIGITDIEGFKIGQAENVQAGTGCMCGVEVLHRGKANY